MSGSDLENTQDVRHVLNNVLAVARRRRWVFILPTSLAVTAALVYSFTYPRSYMAKSMFERRDSAVMSNLIRSYQYNPYTFAKLRGSIYVDLKGYKSVEKAVNELGLDKDLPRDAEGNLSEEGERIKQTMINRFSEKCEVYLQDKSDTRDLVTIQLPSQDPELAAALLTRLRDNYIQDMQEKMNQLLRAALEYWEGVAEEKRARVEDLQAKHDSFVAMFTGLDPANPVAVDAQLRSLKAQREDVERRIDALRLDIANNEEILGMAQPTSRPKDRSKSPEVLAVRVAEPPTKPNPEYAEIETKIQAIRDRILELKMTMTEEHPTIQRMRLKIAQLEQELARTPPAIPIESPPASHAAALEPDQNEPSVLERVRQAERAKAEVAIRSLKTRLTTAERELQSLAERIKDYTAKKAAMVQRRDEFVALKENLEIAKGDLKKEKERVHNVAQLLNATKSRRGIVFTVLEDTRVSPKPVSPKLERLLMLNIGFGIAVGLGFVLLFELLDPTFRTTAQVAEVLKLPVLQSLGEIILPEVRRKRLAKQVVLHAVAVVLIGLACLTGGLVYLSLERPQTFEKIKENPNFLSRQLAGLADGQF